MGLHNNETDQNEEYESVYLFGLEFPVYRQLWMKTTFIVWIVMLTILMISLAFFQYEMTNADLPCGALAGVLLAYLITLIINW